MTGTRSMAVGSGSGQMRSAKRLDRPEVAFCAPAQGDGGQQGACAARLQRIFSSAAGGCPVLSPDCQVQRGAWWWLRPWALPEA